MNDSRIRFHCATLHSVHMSEIAEEAQVSVKLGQRQILPFGKRKAV